MGRDEYQGVGAGGLSIKRAKTYKRTTRESCIERFKGRYRSSSLYKAWERI